MRGKTCYCSCFVTKEKKTSPSSHAIIRFFGATNPYQKNDEQHHQFWEILMFYTCKGYMPLFNCENVWLSRLVLHQYP
jgi:hypothetical protein